MSGEGYDRYNAETGCCPRFEPSGFDEKEHFWNDKKFIKDKVKCFMHIPLNVGKVMVRNSQKLDAADAFPAEPPIVLFDEDSLWHSDVYIECTKDIPDSEMATMCGEFLTKVFEGPYKEVKNWYAQMVDFVKSKGKQPRKIYACYTTCPKCAKYYGKNYTVMFAQV